jgi:hypothetical protein
MIPELPKRKGKTTRRKKIDGKPLEYTVIDEDIFIAPSNPNKAFALHKIRYDDGYEEIRIGYYMIAHRPKMKGKWAWGQYAQFMTKEDLELIFTRAKESGWIFDSKKSEI